MMRPPPELYIWFTDNERPYGYRAVPHEIFDELCDARSHGRFFADQIRDRYEIIPPP